ncbi:type VI secretion system secreted protein VgrG [Pseudomonas agarici]|nr:type VI secretion system tip protein TssI/VgrG [Pseudomonas agarici]SEL70177.1 type VI secretion system secreted protein VgrG [Pseudomonas agarici]
MQKDFARQCSAQHKRLIKLTVDVELRSELLVESFTGTEAICEPFSFELSLLSQDNHLELKTLIGRPALLEIELFDGDRRLIHGHISRFAHVDHDAGAARYSATLSSWLWMLGQRKDSRIFQEQTVIDVARLVFDHYTWMARYRIDVGNPPQSHSYLTQFNETDEQFIRRLFEEEGWLFFFEHSAEGHTLVITDDSSYFKPLAQQPSIGFQPPSGPNTRDHVTHWCAERQLQAAAVTLCSFDYKRPGYGDCVMTVPTGIRQGQVPVYERYEFTGYYSHKGYDSVRPLARRHAQALKAQGKTFRGASNCRALVPGYSFRLTGHRRHDYEPPGRQQEYSPEDYPFDRRDFLLLSVQHVAHNDYLPGQQANYSNTFTCIRRKIAYRPECKIPRPRIGGPLIAIVVGPEGVEEVHTDELARVKVRFHWQREQDAQVPDYERHARDTTWVRVAQPSAGAGFGHQFLPRIGQEVLVSFLGGDICRPVITGVLYNAR